MTKQRHNDQAACIDGITPGMHPGEKILHKALRKTFLFMEAAQEKTAKKLADSGGVKRGEFEKAESSSYVSGNTRS